jgi:hypothetical protein
MNPNGGLQNMIVLMYPDAEPWLFVSLHQLFVNQAWQFLASDTPFAPY